METIENNEDLAVALALSYDYPVALLKLSNTCPLSRQVFDRFKELEERSPEVAERVFVLIVQKSREISDAIATRFGVVHESPQVLVIENEDVVYYESHEEVVVDKVEKLLQDKGNATSEYDGEVLEEI